MKLKKVLIVDDSELLHNMYQMMLKKHDGCVFGKAKNGQEALDILAGDSNFDLIILDINMPVMNGMEFMETLNRENLHKHIPIVIISTEGKEEDSKRGLDLGAKGYITKPFEASTLCAKIEEVVGAG